MKNFYILLLFILLPLVVYSQAIKDMKIRDIDDVNFQKIKLYISVLDEKDNPITTLDSGSITISEKETGEKWIPKPTLFYNSNEGMLICVSMDASNSMDGPPLNNCKQGLLNTLNDFRAVDKMGIAIFHDDFLKRSEFGNDREVLKNNINDLHTGGSSTELYKSVIKSIEWLKSIETPKRKVLILISDGDDNGTEYRIGDCINEIKKSGISVFTIGSIEEKKENQGTLMNMEKLATASADGKYFKINSPDDIKKIIPAIYERIKQEYIFEYYSFAEPNTNLNGSVEINFKNKTYTKDFKYTSPKSIVENHPSKSFWKTSEFLYGSIGAGIIIAVLAVFMVININKKKKFKREKDREKQLREQESAESRERFEKLMSEYNDMLDKMEKQTVISQSDKEKIELLENKMIDVSKTVIGGIKPVVDTRRRTQILSGKAPDFTNPVTGNYTYATITVTSGSESGKQVMVPAENFIIGRLEGNLVISDNTVSRRHARIFMQDSKYIIEDLGSTNGTFVNNYRVTRSVIKSGDKLRVGNIELTFYGG